jgi:hypothetical protein
VLDIEITKMKFVLLPRFMPRRRRSGGAFVAELAEIILVEALAAALQFAVYRLLGWLLPTEPALVD